MIKIKFILLIFLFTSALLYFAGGVQASSSYTFDGVTSGFSGASCTGATSDWVVVRAFLKDSVTGNDISTGTFNAGCKSDNFDGTYYYEGPDAQHSIERKAAKCGGGDASSGSTVCMGGCTLPFNLKASAPGYLDSDTWLVNHEAGVDNTLYPEGNGNTANYTIYLDPVPPPACPSAGQPGTTTTCGQATYDSCTDNIGQTGLNVCKNGASTFTCYSSVNNSCTSPAYTCSDYPACSPPSSTPTNPSYTCSNTSPTHKVQWTSMGSGITYNLRVDRKDNLWDSTTSCSTNPGDFCVNGLNSSNHPFDGALGIKYGWWVHACNAYGCTGSATTGPDFTCASCTTSLAAPELSSPTQNQRFPASTTDITLSWKSVTEANRYQVRVTDDNNTVIINDQRTTNLSYPVSVTPGRTYTWSVKAIKDAAGTCNEVQSAYSTGTFIVDKANIEVSCSASSTTSPPSINQDVTWTADVTQTPVRTPYTYSWDFGTSSGYSCITPSINCTGNNSSAVIKYNSPGNKTTTVNVTDKDGTTNKGTCSITITAPDLITQNLTYSGSTIVEAAMTFSGKVNNQGDASTGSSGSSFNARFCIDNASCLTSTTGRVGGDITVPALPATTLSSTITSSSWTATLGLHTIYFCADVGATVTESNEGPASNCSQLPFTVSAAGTPPAPTVTTSLPCIPPGYTGSGFTITYGSRTPPVIWADISPSFTFSSYYHKSVSDTTSTTAPNEFNLNPSDPPQPLTLNPSTDYFARVSDGTQNSQVRTFTTPPSCPAAFDYSLSNSGGITLKQGSSGSNTITRTLVSGTPSGVFLSASGLPLGASASFTSNPSSPTSPSTLTISTSPTTPVGSYNITVTGSPLSKTTVFALTVNPPGGLCDGDGTCDVGETTLTCPTDCPNPPGGTCPNNICEAGETCPIDCPAGGPICGNNTCEGNEPVTSCRLPDCPGVPAPIRRSKPWIQIKGDVHSNTGIR